MAVLCKGFRLPTVAAGRTYPLIAIDVPLVAGPGATSYACTRHPLGSAPADRVWTTYTTSQKVFAYAAHAVAGEVP